MNEHDVTRPEPIRLIDGREMVIRRMRSDDAPRLQAFFDRLSPHARRMRFFTPMRLLSPRFAAELARVDFVERAAFVATFPREDDVRAVGRYHRDENDAANAEVAFTVQEDLQGQGIATHLLRHLTQLALENGITCFTALVLHENEDMLEVFRNSGLAARVINEGDLFRVEMKLA